MGSLLRSEEMALTQFFVQPEAAYSVVAELGETGCVQFRDLNEEINVFQREFASDVKRCNEMERQLHYIESEIMKTDIKISDISDQPKAPNPREIVSLEAHLEKMERDVRELTEGEKTLKKEYMEQLQRRHVLLKAQAIFNQKEEDLQHDLTTEEIKNASQLGFLAGVISKEKSFAFEKTLWRYGMGNIYYRHADIEEAIEDPETGKEMRKVAFIVFYQGDNLQTKINKLCAGFKATLVDIPESLAVRQHRIVHVTKEVNDIKVVIKQLEETRQRLLVSVAKDIQNWSIIVQKMKAIYHTLNLFSLDVSKKCFIAEGWIPTSDLSTVQKVLTTATETSGSSVMSFLNIMKTKETPPTYNRTNKFTQGFQNLISAYASSTYRELNPDLEINWIFARIEQAAARMRGKPHQYESTMNRSYVVQRTLYTIVTFPFLFAVMFGDVGHGLIMALFGLWMVVQEKKIIAQKSDNEIFNIFFGGRYIILMMGIFSIYTGFIYNDFFSKSLNIFGSKWVVDPRSLPDNFTKYTETDATTKVQLIPRLNYKGNPYLFGLDPAWQSAENKIILLNSLKMKLSIIFGVVHMIFGISLSTINFVHFKKYSHIFLEFLPKILFFVFLFFYLAFMISLKWFMFSGMNDGASKNDTSPGVDTPHGSSCAPNVLIFFIGMILFKKSELKPPCEKYMFEGQELLQRVLVVAALLCIPIMLLGVPIHEMMARKKKKALPVYSKHNGRSFSQGSLEPVPETSMLTSHDEEEEEPMGSLMVEAAIHTIEFSLSTVSHTASYLRLWALSLAHAQLSDVLWTMVFRRALTSLSTPYVGSVFIYIIFAAWSSITVAILVLMEGLSAFLHTLRLHWVEFMTKFYQGEGYQFMPFSFKNMLEEEEE